VCYYEESLGRRPAPAVWAHRHLPREICGVCGRCQGVSNLILIIQIPNSQGDCFTPSGFAMTHDTKFFKCVRPLKKISRPSMGRDEFPRYHPIGPLPAHSARRTSASLLTLGLRIGLLSMNRIYPVPTVHPTGSRGNFDWVWLSAAFSRHSASLATSANLLSSFTAVDLARLLPVIIAGFNRMSRLENNDRFSHCGWYNLHHAL
jgi:hypothetical protein